MIKDKYVTLFPHITKVDKDRFRGMYEYFYPPRIGIDFFLPEEYPLGYYDYIPNLELGDVARLVKILELIRKEDILDSLKSKEIKPFKIGLAFENDLQRRIIMRAKSNHLVIHYEGYHKSNWIEFDYDLSRIGAEKLLEALKDLVIEYIDFIQRYVMTGKIDGKFK